MRRPGTESSGTWSRFCRHGRRRTAGPPERGPLGHTRARHAAFTLLEVLVAMTIFAMAAVMLASAYLNVLNAYEAVSRGVVINEDFAFARQLVLNEPDPKKLEEGGEFETAGGRRARWSAEIESTTVADVYRVTFTCTLDDPARPAPEEQRQSFLVLRPSWLTDPGERGKLKEEAKTRILELQGKLQQGQGAPAPRP